MLNIYKKNVLLISPSEYIIVRPCLSDTNPHMVLEICIKLLFENLMIYFVFFFFQTS